MSKGYGSAHGKIILIGEHAVVYGYKAIALPLLTGVVETTVEEAQRFYFESTLYEGLLETSPKALEAIRRLVFELQKQHALPPLKITVSTNLAPYAGLGFSAALASSIVQAVYDYRKLPLDDETHFHWTQFSEKIAHGNPSGIDATLVMSEQPLIFQKGQQTQEVNFNLNGYLIIGNSGIRGETKKAVDHIAKMHSTYQDTLNALGDLTEDMIHYIQKKNLKAIGNAISKAHRFLTLMSVSHPMLEEMIEDALTKDALGAKLSGGGLGGAVIAITNRHDTAKNIKESWEQISNKEAWILPLKAV